MLVLAPIAIYVLSVSDTVRLYKEYCQAKGSAGTVHATDRMEELPASVPMLSSGVLMRMISGVCVENKVSVGHFSPEEAGREGSLCLVSAQLSFTGDFVGLLKVLASIGNIHDIKVTGAEFSTMKAGKNGKALKLELRVLQLEDHRL